MPMGAHILTSETKASRSKRDNETRTEKEESCASNFAVKFIQLKGSQVRIQLVTGLFFFSRLMRVGFGCFPLRVIANKPSKTLETHQNIQKNI